MFLDNITIIGFAIWAAIMMGLVSTIIGVWKGYSGSTSFWWGFILGPIGIIVEAVRPYEENEQIDIYSAAIRKANEEY